MVGLVARERRLAGFIRWLEERGLFRFDVSSFNSRLRVQKYVFIARFFGLDLGYNFSLYIRGPYSPDLARDYYRIDVGAVEPWVPRGFRSKEFLDLVGGRDERWLELASTILLVSEETRNLDRIVEIVCEIKPSFSRVEVEGVVRELCSLIC